MTYVKVFFTKSKEQYFPLNENKVKKIFGQCRLNFQAMNCLINIYLFFSTKHLLIRPSYFYLLFLGNPQWLATVEKPRWKKWAFPFFFIPSNTCLKFQRPSHTFVYRLIKKFIKFYLRKCIQVMIQSSFSHWEPMVIFHSVSKFIFTLRANGHISFCVEVHFHTVCQWSHFPMK